MRINYNVTGAKRKELVNVISTTIGEKSEYQFMPTCNFKVGDLTVTKDGALEWDERTTQETIERITAALNEAGFTSGTVDIEKKEEHEEPHENASKFRKTDLVIEVPLDSVQIENLTNILESKGTLIKHALGIDNLHFENREDRIIFPWFKEMLELNEVTAYTQFISLLCKLSKELKRARSIETPVTNEKYAFRCFLLRLGFIGPEYKESRMILLKNLSGNSSWKNGAPKKAEKKVEA
jgi:hypothetical protein